MLKAIASALLLFATSTAFAVPMQLGHQGRLLDAAGGAVEDTHDVVFTLYDADTAGTILFSESMRLDIQDGRYSVTLGTDEVNNPLGVEVFDGSTRYLGVAVDGGTEMSPRTAVVSVPYAVRASVAHSVDGGVVNATEIQINDTTVINANGEIVGTLIGDEDTLRDLGCSDGDIVSHQGGQWLCVALEGSHTHSADEVGLGVLDDGNPLNHARYDNTDARGAMGTEGDGNPLNHTRFTAAEAITAMEAPGDGNPLNHARFTTADAVAAMGGTSNGNPLNHNRPPTVACTTVSGAGSAGTCWGASKIFCPSGYTMTGGGIQQSNESLEQSRPCNDSEGQCFVCDNVGGCGRGTCFVRCCQF